MPDTTPTVTPAPAVTPAEPQNFGIPRGDIDPAAVKSANADTIRASEAQGRHTGMNQQDLTDASSALDALATSITAPVADPPPAPPGQEPVPPPSPVLPAPSAPEPPAQPSPSSPPGKDIFADISLPPKASVKSADAFATVKERAAAEIQRVTQELAAEKAARAELEKKASTVPEEVTKELEELRQFRATLDVRADPKWKEFDNRAAKTEEFIFAQLKKSPRVTQEHLAEIKKLGGLGKINLSKFLDSLEDPTLAGIVRSKYADMELILHEKEQAREEAEKRASEYVKERAEAMELERGSVSSAAKRELEALKEKVTWLKPKAATEPGAAEHNKLLDQVRAEVEATLQDDSPKMRAILALGMGRLTLITAANEAKAKALSEAEARIADLTKQLDGIKQASSRLRSGGAPVDGNLPVPRPVSGVNTDSAGALDAIAQQVLVERQRAGVA